MNVRPAPTNTRTVYVVKRVIDHPRYMVPIEIGRRYGRAQMKSMGFEVDHPRFKEFFDEILVNCYTGEEVK